MLVYPMTRAIRRLSKRRGRSSRTAASHVLASSRAPDRTGHRVHQHSVRGRDQGRDRRCVPGWITTAEAPTASDQPSRWRTCDWPTSHVARTCATANPRCANGSDRDVAFVQREHPPRRERPPPLIAKQGVTSMADGTHESGRRSTSRAPERSRRRVGRTGATATLRCMNGERPPPDRPTASDGHARWIA